MANANKAVAFCLLACYRSAWSEGELWRPVGWGGGGLYWSVAYHPKKDGTLYMGGDVVGVYKSLDHGLTWKHRNRGIAGYEVLTLATDPSQPERVYAVTTNGISRSENGGEVWTTLKGSPPNQLGLVCQKFRSMHCLAVDPGKSRRLAFAAPDGRVLESQDFGTTWTVRLKIPSGFACSVAFQPGHGALFAATSSGLYRIGGENEPMDLISREPASWRPKRFSSASLRISPESKETERCLNEPGNSLPFIVAPGFVTPKEIEAADEPIFPSTIRGVSELANQSGEIVGPISLPINPNERRIAGNPGFYSTTSAEGKGPENEIAVELTAKGHEPPKLLIPGKAYAVVFDATGASGYAAMADQGVWRTVDGGSTWKPTGLQGKSGEEWIDVVVDSKNPLEVHAIQTTGWGGEAAFSEDGGQSWSTVGKIRPDTVWNPTDLEGSKAGPANLSAPRNLAINPLNGKELFIAANWRPVCTTDSGRTWSERSRGADISVVTDVQFVAGKTYVTAMDEGLFVSDNSPLGWHQLLPLRWSKDISGHQWRVRVWDNGKQILTSGSPWDTPQNVVFRSMDSGQTFIKVTDGLPTYLPTENTMCGRGYPRALAVEAANPYTVYLGIDGNPSPSGTGGGIFKSVDGGWHWTQLKNQPPSRRMFNGIAVDPTDPKRLFWGACGVGGGLYRSEDGGESWKLVFSKEDWVFNVTLSQDGTIYCPGKQLWVSQDHSSTWRQVTQFGDGVSIVDVQVDTASPNRIWLSRTAWDASTTGGVWETTNAGQTWHSILGNLPCERPTILRYNPATKELWAAGPGLFALKR